MSTVCDSGGFEYVTDFHSEADLRAQMAINTVEVVEQFGNAHLGVGVISWQ